MIDTIQEMCSFYFYIHRNKMHGSRLRMLKLPVHDETNSRIQLPQHETGSPKSEDLPHEIYAISSKLRALGLLQ